MDSLHIALAVVLAISVCLLARMNYRKNAVCLDAKKNLIEISKQQESIKQYLTALQNAEVSLKETEEKLAMAKKEPSYDCRELLHDLTAGSAAVKITRLDPSEIYIRRT